MTKGFYEYCVIALDIPLHLVFLTLIIFIGENYPAKKSRTFFEGMFCEEYLKWKNSIV